jgi:hypothetical protein
MLETVGKKSWKQPMQCWYCGGNHMYRDFPQRGDKSRTVHIVQNSMKVEDMGVNVPSIYTTLDNK